MRLITLLGGAIFHSLFLFSVHSFAQQPTPTPEVIEENDDVVRITTSVIQLDVTVTDRKGKPFSGLTAEDFEVYENGRLQKISGLRYVSRIREVQPQNNSVTNGVPEPPRPVRPDQIRRTIALVVDDLSLSFSSVYYTRRALKKFVDEQMQEGDLVAIIRTGAGVGALQQFTHDKRILYAAIDRVKWNSMGNGGIGAFAPIEPTPLETAAAMGDADITEEDLEDERNYNNSVEDFRSSVFAAGTLGALRFIVKGMEELPGRKSVMMFSDGFRMLERERSGGVGAGRVADFMSVLIDEANRASVVFYTLDPRGLVYTGITAADQIVSSSPQSINQTMSDRSNQLFETQSGLKYLAEETGGFAHTNNNSLTQGVNRVLDDQSYYLLAYEPDEETFDPAKKRFNKLEIKVKRNDLNVRYRSGFFNVSEENRPTPNSAALPPMQQLTNALMSPFAVNDIELGFNSLVSRGEKNEGLIRPILHINAERLKFVEGKDNKKNLNLTIVSTLFGDNGVLVDEFGRKFEIGFDEEQVKMLLKQGLIYDYILPVKKHGAYQFRIAVRDDNGNIVGSASQFVEIPNFKKKGAVISSIILRNFSLDEWQTFIDGKAEANSSNRLSDVAVKRFKNNSVLSYGYEIYNPRINSAKKPELTSKVRIFHNGKLMHDGKEQPVDISKQTDMQRIGITSAMRLAETMSPGDYVLQVVVTDKLAKGKSRVTSRHIDFEIIE